MLVAINFHKFLVHFDYSEYLSSI